MRTRPRAQIVRTGDPDLFPELNIPRRTVLSWIRRGIRNVVTLDEETSTPDLHVRIAKLERRVAMLSAILRLVLTLLRTSGFQLERARIPDAANKRDLLRAIERACKAMPLSAALRVLRLSPARYHAWVRADGACALDDRPSCPRSKVQRLTYREVEAIGDMVQSAEHRGRIRVHEGPECSTPQRWYPGPMGVTQRNRRHGPGRAPVLVRGHQARRRAECGVPQDRLTRERT